MGPNIVEKGKTPDVINLPGPDVEAVHVLRYRQLQEEHEAKVKKLIAELEERQEAIQKKLETSFAERERRLIEDLQAQHMAECRRLELAAVDREHALMVKLNVARRRLIMVIIGAILVILGILNFRAISRINFAFLVPSARPSVQDTSPEVVSALLPHLSAPEVVWTAPTFDNAEKAPDQKTGNGGIFVRGNM